MGILLAFMFLWNMLGALIIVPSLVTFLLPDRKPATQADGQQPVIAAQEKQQQGTALLARAS